MICNWPSNSNDIGWLVTIVLRKMSDVNFSSEKKLMHRSQVYSGWIVGNSIWNWEYRRGATPHLQTAKNKWSSLTIVVLIFIVLIKHKNLGRLWLAYTELQRDFRCYNSHLLPLGTLHSQNSAYGGLIYTNTTHPSIK